MSVQPLSLDATCGVLVVVPTLNEAAHISDLLHFLLEETSGFLSRQIVIVDGGSSDETRLIVARVAENHAYIHLMENPARIQSAAVNLAVSTYGSKAGLLIRCDAHSTYPRGFCRSLAKSLHAHGADSVVVPMDSIGDGCLQRAVAWVSNSTIGTGGSAHRAGRQSGFVDHGHHAAFRMDVFRQVGGYDETFTHNEDADFDCRQRALGARVYLDASIRIAYHPRSTIGGLWRQYFNYGVGRSRTVRRHPRSIHVRQLAVPLNFLIMIGSMALAPVWPLLLMFPMLYFFALLLTAGSFLIRKRSACALLTPAVAWVMHMAWACGFFKSLLSTRERVWKSERTKPLTG